MDIQVQGGSDVGMAEQGTESFEVTFAFDAPGGESVPQTMNFPCGDLQVPGDLLEMIPERLRVHGPFFPGDNVLLRIRIQIYLF